jgi:hypothetical protein
LDKAVAREANLTRAAVAAQITPASPSRMAQISSLQSNPFSRVDKIECDANMHLEALQTNTVDQIEANAHRPGSRARPGGEARRRHQVVVCGEQRAEDLRGSLARFARLAAGLLAIRGFHDNRCLSRCS